MDKDAIRRRVMIEQCCFQIEQCLKLLNNPKTRHKTRSFRVQLLKEELVKLTQLQPDHPGIAAGREALELIKQQ